MNHSDMKKVLLILWNRFLKIQFDLQIYRHFKKQDTLPSCLLNAKHLFPKSQRKQKTNYAVSFYKGDEEK